MCKSNRSEIKDFSKKEEYEGNKEKMKLDMTTEIVYKC